jgi:pimeloyl-ACP methyl ester carboxylesterase
MRALPTALVDDAIVLDDGRRLAYAEWGAPSGTPLVFLHGNAGFAPPGPRSGGLRGPRHPG